ncbi:MAG: helix-turn-helix domain-containing protein [Acidobacteria bacterium]|jgi:transcriptional regulator with XRE-family HTH domain|nr:helix-turn-helix domain-containing protein [Acidobacteriota bacterium]
MKKKVELQASSFGERVRNVRKALGLNQKELSRPLDITHSFLSEIENNKYKPGYEFFCYMFSKYNVNLHYLFSGTGEMFNPELKPADSKPKPPPPAPGLITDENDLMWYIERSPFFKYLILGYACKAFYDNRTNIDKEIEKSEPKEKD